MKAFYTTSLRFGASSCIRKNSGIMLLRHHVALKSRYVWTKAKRPAQIYKAFSLVNVSSIRSHSSHISNFLSLFSSPVMLTAFCSEDQYGDLLNKNWFETLGDDKESYLPFGHSGLLKRK